MLTVLLALSYVTHVLLLDTADNGNEELVIILSERTGEMAGAVPFSLCWLPLLLLTLVVFPICPESLLVI
jgi:hypothetical protein